ncbi:UDP-N-acetylenolpyruvoylglucosamine reductase [Xylocopilactobacillus apicola]|uniref:UDP-N-acetylenolpyruvoylglucosamine reductase n=2 Tax=Xylocopilactobacillus apicola TaxID=2932184 RepID=A0AAU9D4S0_9LACO|nr:UDP-N-acetylenolpyruvoylglucosamine reductase [Xylocopilactobacillus apicola]
MAEFTYTLTGGYAEYLARPKNQAELEYLVQRAIAYKIPYLLLGNASNVIVSDDGLSELVIIMTDFSQIEVKGSQIIASAGAKLKDVTLAAGKSGLTGIEFACGIPGTLGGAIFMNAGAYGGEISSVISRIRAINSAGKIVEYEANDFHFGYRQSRAQEENLVVVQAVINLVPGDPEKIIQLMDELNERRAARQPLELPSCGSVFRRPPGHFVGPMIQESGLQGKQIGGAQVSKKHAGFIVNIDHATAGDYVALIHLIQKTVFEKFGIHLKPEVRFLGFKDGEV